MLPRVWVLPANEDWICDQLAKDWIDYNPDLTVNDPESADVIWLLADWCFKHLPYELLKKKKVVTTVHHIVPEKFTHNEKLDFAERDRITDVYHVYNQRVFDFIRPLTNKPIRLIPYWANQNLWKRSDLNKFELRKKYGLPIDGCFYGSFQRDTEGKDLITPKWEKGPDLFVDFIEREYQLWMVDRDVLSDTFELPEPHIVLAGWRRQYVISRLEKAKIPFTYFERPSQEILSDLYQTLDIYPVASRCEGGPQALIECGLLGVRCLSRPVGIAEQVLPPIAISPDLKGDATVPNVAAMMLPHGFEGYRKLFKEIAT